MAHEYETNDPAEALARALSTHVGDDEVGDVQVAVTAVHVPGTPLPRVEDEASSRAFEADVAAAAPDAAPLPLEYDGIDTRTPDGNYDTRSNIERP